MRLQISGTDVYQVGIDVAEVCSQACEARAPVRAHVGAAREKLLELAKG